MNELDLDSGWRIGEATFALIADRIRERQIRRLVEFGSGASTVRLALAFPEMTVIAVEHDESFVEATRGWLAQHQALNAKVVYAPLRDFAIDCRRFRTYEFRTERGVDGVIIDGPPSSTRRGREGCLYLVFDSALIGATIFLDDADRPDEQRIVRNWELSYPKALTIRRHSLGHGLAEAVKLRDDCPTVSAATLLDNGLARMQLALPGRLAPFLERVRDRVLGAPRSDFGT